MCSRKLVALILQGFSVFQNHVFTSIFPSHFVIPGPFCPAFQSNQSTHQPYFMGQGRPSKFDCPDRPGWMHLCRGTFPAGSYYDFMNRLWHAPRDAYARIALLPAGKNRKNPQKIIGPNGKLMEPEDPCTVTARDIVHIIILRK